VNQDNKLAWSALEYEDKVRNPDWFWALGVIVVATSVATIIFGSYFFAALILISGGMLAYFAKKEPRTIYYELNEHGLKIGAQVYLYENIKSFHIETQTRPTLFVKTERLFMPVLSIPINPDFAEEVEQILLGYNVTEEKMQEHPSEKIMEFLGF